LNFETFAFHPRIRAGIDAAGYHTPTPIQTHAIPPILQGSDLLGLAQTGTGKTAAFVLPILQHLLDVPRGKPRALILSPTRELAEQTHMAIRALGKLTGLRSITMYGGVSQLPQIKGLQAGAEILVACPGRLLDMIGQKLVRTDLIQYLVIDEADRMFDMGFLPDVRRIVASLPKQRQTLLFSATMPAEIRKLAADFLYQPVNVEIQTDRPLETITHAVVPLKDEDKLEMLRTLLPQAGSGQVLVFTRTKHRAKRLAEKLVQCGFSANALQGNLSQNRRLEAMDNFRSGRVQIMVATDIAARGIDVSQVTHVINFDLPDTAEAYTHRTGRTGRMERLGTAISLATADDLAMLRAIERMMGKPLERRRMDGFECITLDTSQPAGQSAPRRTVPTRQPDNRPARSYTTPVRQLQTGYAARGDNRNPPSRQPQAAYSNRAEDRNAPDRHNPQRTYPDRRSVKSE
jgi:ATP-dependent RNA helicase RhlE